jgi:hypothetical protein
MRWRTFLAATACFAAALSSSTASGLPSFVLDVVTGIPPGGVVQFGSTDPTDISLVLQIPVIPGVGFSVTSLHITGGGTIPGPDLDVVLALEFATVRPSASGEGTSDRFFISFAESSVGSRVQWASLSSTGGVVGAFEVPAVPAPSTPTLLVWSLAAVLLACSRAV